MNKPHVKCAIYTRKSSEEGLDQSFNSLEAQREACKAYVVSQKHEGWTMLAKHYDDGGYSGGSMDRPALKTLLDDIKAEKINTIVVYKVDRLTRSLADFAKIVEILDERGVSFVSVTQQFNTTSSMGRLTLNVLLSFAQFEREITGERIRDKIAASKRKGMWMGGVVPLGYDVVERRLIVNPIEAEQVRLIFRKYLQLRCVSKLKKFLAQGNIRSKVRTTSAGRSLGGSAFSRGALYHLLNNRIYLGDIVHRDAAFAGQHEAIVSARLWESVTDQLRKNNRANRIGRSKSAPSLLRGKLFDDNGIRFTPTHAVRNGKRYRYYTSQTLVTGRGAVPPIGRYPAQELEAAVISLIYNLLSAPDELVRGTPKGFDSERMLRAAKKSAEAWVKWQESQRRELVRSVIQRVIVSEGRLHTEVSIPALMSLLLRQKNTADSIPKSGRKVLSLSVDLQTFKRGCETRIVTPDGAERTPVQSVVKAVAQSHDWYQKIVNGQIWSIGQLVVSSGYSQAYVRRILQCANMAPTIVERILKGRHASDLTLRAVVRRLPLQWSQQDFMIGSSNLIRDGHFMNDKGRYHSR